jgi:hypothetical protein
MTEPSKKILFRDAMSSWQFWMGVAYFGLVLVVGALYFQNGRILDAQRRAEQAQTIRIAEVHSRASSQFTQCVASIPTLVRVNEFTAGVQELAGVLVENAEANHAATPPASPVYATQEKSLRRLKNSVELVSGIRFPVPTRQACIALRNRTLAGG